VLLEAAYGGRAGTDRKKQITALEPQRGVYPEFPPVGSSQRCAGVWGVIFAERSLQRHCAAANLLIRWVPVLCLAAGTRRDVQDDALSGCINTFRRKHPAAAFVAVRKHQAREGEGHAYLRSDGNRPDWFMRQRVIWFTPPMRLYLCARKE